MKLQWKDVSLEQREIRILAENAKDDEVKYLPISNRLAAVLEMGRFDPAGHPLGPDAYVFGDEIGRPIKSPKKAWSNRVSEGGDCEPPLP